MLKSIQNAFSAVKDIARRAKPLLVVLPAAAIIAAPVSASAFQQSFQQVQGSCWTCSQNGASASVHAAASVVIQGSVGGGYSIDASAPPAVYMPVIPVTQMPQQPFAVGGPVQRQVEQKPVTVTIIVQEKPCPEVKEPAPVVEKKPVVVAKKKKKSIAKKKYPCADFKNCIEDMQANGWTVEPPKTPKAAGNATAPAPSVK